MYSNKKRAYMLKTRPGGVVFTDSSFYGIFYIFFIVSILFYYYVKPEDVADYYSYLKIANDLYYYNQYMSSYFEVGSSTILYSSFLFSGSAHGAIVLSRIFTTLIFFAFIYVMHRYYKIGSLSLVIVLALYGPLLSYVTIRATPAYILIILSILESSRGKSRSLLWALLAIQFHISALLGLILTLASFIQTRNRILNFGQGSNRKLVLFFMIYLSFYFIFNDFFTSALNAIVDNIYFLNKYDVYTKSVELGIISSEGSKLYHQIYFIACTVLLLFFLVLNDEFTVKIRLCVITGYIIFLFLQFSPVTAFRFSIFWTIPAIISIPWQKYLYSPLLRIVAAILGLIVFVVQIDTILY